MSLTGSIVVYMVMTVDVCCGVWEYIWTYNQCVVIFVVGKTMTQSSRTLGWVFKT